MNDISETNRTLKIMRYERDRLQHEVSIRSKEIKILELQEEITRLSRDILGHQKVMEQCEFEIAQQKQEIEKEKERIQNANCS